MNETLQQTLWIILALMGTSIVIALSGLLLIARRIRQMRIPQNADFFTTMRYVPFALVILLDLLDFGLDIFSAPIIWLLLDRMGLRSLRNKATLEALIPVTGPIPTFTICWMAARLLNLGSPTTRYLEQYADWRAAGGYAERQPRHVDIIDMEDVRD